MNENDLELQNQLRELGRRPIDVSTMQSHRRRIEAAGALTAKPRRRFGAVSVAAAGIVGFMVGSAGLAMADALPNPAQEVAHDVLGVVQVDVPAGKEGKRGPCVAAAAKLEDKDAKQAAKDACPKGGDDTPEPGTPAPGADVESHGNGNGNGNGTTKHEGDPCHGRPPWAGKMSKEEREAAKQAAPRDACPPDADDDDSGDDDDDKAAESGTADTTLTTVAEQSNVTVPDDTAPATTTTTSATTAPAP